jgi:hypothetical protein
MRQQYLLGSLLRETYIVNGKQYGFDLSETYNRSQVILQFLNLQIQNRSTYVQPTLIEH